MAQFSFYFIVLMCVCCRPSISEEFQLPQNTDIKFKYFVSGLPFEGEIKVIEKPWGKEEVIEINDRYMVKKLTMFKGKKCSLQLW